MKSHQQQALEAGLSEFDRIVKRRRRVRSAAAGVAMALAVGVPGWLLAQRPTHAHEQLPAYVELIHTSAQLGEELALAEACERIGMEGSRLFLVDCTPRSGQ